MSGGRARPLAVLLGAVVLPLNARAWSLGRWSGSLNYKSQSAPRRRRLREGRCGGGAVSGGPEGQWKREAVRRGGCLGAEPASGRSLRLGAGPLGRGGASAAPSLGAGGGPGFRLPPLPSCCVTVPRPPPSSDSIFYFIFFSPFPFSSGRSGTRRKVPPPDRTFPPRGRVWCRGPRGCRRGRGCAAWRGPGRARGR